MDLDDKPGQITAAVGRVCLRFKKTPEGSRPLGQVFVRSTFHGPGGSFFVPTSPAAEGETHVVVDNGIGSAPSSPPSVQSEPVDISRASAAPTEGEQSRAGVSVGDHDHEPEKPSTPGEVVAVVMDLGFCLDTVRFSLADPVLSILDNTEIKIDLCLCSNGGGGSGASGGGDDTEEVIGTACVRVASVLRGENEWTCELSLGTYVPEATPKETGEPDEALVTETVQGDDEGSATIAAVVSQDVSVGPLEFGGSTSTMRVTLLTNDDTADYTLGAGSLWTDGAEITGVPEGWKVVPPPETKREDWNDAIARTLEGPRLHEYSIWWGADSPSTFTENPAEHDATKKFPPMRLDGGVLMYEPEEHSIHTSDDPAEDRDSQSQVSTSSPGNGGGTSGNATKGSTGDDEPPPQVPWDPPTGTWSVRFPSFRSKGIFLHRTSIRELRRSIAAPSQGCRNNNDSDDGKISVKAIPLPVFLERRELPPKPVIEEGKPVGKGAKKGGGKKTPGSKKGEASEPPPRPPEKPWRCYAEVDLLPLVQPVAVDDGARAETTLSSAPGNGVVETEAGDSPLRADLRATLTLMPPAEDTPTLAVADVDGTGGEGTTSQASPAVVPASKGIEAQRDDCNEDSEDKHKANEEEARMEQMKACDTVLVLTIALSRPLFKGTRRQETTVSVSDVFTPSDVGPRKPPRDVDMELKEELDAFVLASLEEYAKLFLEPGAEEISQDLSAEDREKRLFYALNSNGVYHTFLERLKPRVQRIVRKRFGAIPTDSTEADAFVSDLYVHLVEEAAIVLNHRIRNIEATATPSYITADVDKSLEERVQHLGMLADDAEARGKSEEAAARHEDRIEAATAAAATLEEWRTLLALSWEGYGLFLLRGNKRGQQQQGQVQQLTPITTGTTINNGTNNGNSGGPNSRGALDHGARCFEESLRIYPPGSDKSFAVTAVLTAVSMEQGQLDRAWALLENVLEQRMPELEEGADGYETDDLVSLIPRRDHALRCIMRDLMSDSSGARRSLFLAVQSSKREEARGDVGAIVSDDEPGTPRRSPVRVMQDACSWLLELGLPRIARRAFAVAEESERLAVKKAKERGLPTRTPTALRESSRRLKCCLILAGVTTATTTEDCHRGDAGHSEKTLEAKTGTKPSELQHDIELEGVGAKLEKPGGTEEENTSLEGVSMIHEAIAAEKLAREAVELAPGDHRPWQALADACDAQGPVKATEAADAWAAVLDRMEGYWMASSNHDDVGSTVPIPPLSVYMRLGALYNTLGRLEEAKATFLRACRAWRAPGPWLGCGAACLRLEQWQEAEDALQHASRLDCNSSLVWGHLALLLLSMGEARVQEADRALSQALCLGLADPHLLREIGNCYVAAGRLDSAEDAFRKSLAAETSSNIGGTCGVDGGGAIGSGSGGFRKGEGVSSVRGGGAGAGNPHTRRCLADVLSAKNSTSQAVEEYRRVLESSEEEVNSSERQEVLTRCGNLLRKMGRGDELDQLQREAFSSRQQQTC